MVIYVISVITIKFNRLEMTVYEGYTGMNSSIFFLQIGQELTFFLITLSKQSSQKHMCEHGKSTIEGLKGSRHIAHFDCSRDSSIDKENIFKKKTNIPYVYTYFLIY